MNEKNKVPGNANYSDIKFIDFLQMCDLLHIKFIINFGKVILVSNEIYVKIF